MALAYRYMTAEQDKLRNVFEKGQYPFSVINVEKKLCKNKINNMLVVDLNIHNQEGRNLIVKDWIMLDIENMEWKLRHFADACGLLDKYDNQTLNEEDFLNKNGIAKVYIDEYEKDGEMQKINRISDYVKSGPKSVNKVNDSLINAFNDDIPF